MKTKIDWLKVYLISLGLTGALTLFLTGVAIYGVATMGHQMREQNSLNAPK